jgi:hypothetical protein
MTDQPASETGQHTPEPWHDGEAAGLVLGSNDEAVAIAHDHDRPRIVACVNACAGIPTEKLELECKDINVLRTMMSIQDEQMAASGRIIVCMTDELIQAKAERDRLREEKAALRKRQQNLVLQACLHVRHHEGPLVDCIRIECSEARAAIPRADSPHHTTECEQGA